jgi:hypothetical protein
VRCGRENAPYLGGELLPNGDLLFHCHGERARLSDNRAMRFVR